MFFFIRLPCATDRCDSLLNVVVVRDILWVKAVKVGLVHEIWEPRYLTVVLVLTSVLSAKCICSGGCK